MPHHDRAKAEESPAAPFLFGDEIIEKITEAEAVRREYTAERCPPALKAAIIELRARGMGQLSVAKLLGCHHKTVDAIDDTCAVSIDIVRQKVIKNLRRGGEKMVDLIISNPEKIPAQSWAMTAGILLDKAEQMEGRATVRVEHVERIDIFGDWDSFVAQQLEPRQLNAGEVTEISSQMSLGAGKEITKEGPAEEPPSDPAAGVDVPSTRQAVGSGGDQASGLRAGTDGESDVQRGEKDPTPDLSPDLTAGNDQALAPDPDRASGQTPGGGAPAAQGPVGSTNKPGNKILGNGGEAL